MYINLAGKPSPHSATHDYFRETGSQGIEWPLKTAGANRSSLVPRGFGGHNAMEVVGIRNEGCTDG
jgi:hypothetical protein